MNRYEQRLAAFYAAFRELDAASMRAAYAPAARFQDPVFRLAGRDEIGAMWAMLCEATARNGRDVWRLDVGEIVADASYGRARWEAHYRFSATGRMVHNVVEAGFSFDAGGRILTHRDRFDTDGLVADDSLGVITIVDTRFECLNALTRKDGAFDTSNELFRFSTEHRADDHFDRANRTSR